MPMHLAKSVRNSLHDLIKYENCIDICNFPKSDESIKWQYIVKRHGKLRDEALRHMLVYYISQIRLI